VKNDVAGSVGRSGAGQLTASSKNGDINVNFS